MFSYEFSEILKNIFFYRTPLVAASVTLFDYTDSSSKTIIIIMLITIIVVIGIIIITIIIIQK